MSLFLGMDRCGAEVAYKRTIQTILGWLQTRTSIHRQLRPYSLKQTYKRRKYILRIKIQTSTDYPKHHLHQATHLKEPDHLLSQSCHLGLPYLWEIYPARALRALGLLLADGTPTGGRGEDFLNRQPNFFTETAVTPERKVEKSFPRWEINRHVEG